MSPQTAASIGAVIKHVWTEPKAVAKIHWMEYQREHAPSLMDQIFAQVGYGAAEQFASGGGWPDPDQRITLVRYDLEEPDWDWWEPRHDQLWRRTTMRNAAFDVQQRESPA